MGASGQLASNTPASSLGPWHLAKLEAHKQMRSILWKEMTVSITGVAGFCNPVCQGENCPNPAERRGGFRANDHCDSNHQHHRSQSAPDDDCAGTARAAWLTEKINFLAFATPILAFAGLSIAKDVPALRRLSWRILAPLPAGGTPGKFGRRDALDTAALLEEFALRART